MYNLEQKSSKEGDKKEYNEKTRYINCVHSVNGSTLAF